MKTARDCPELIKRITMPNARKVRPSNIKYMREVSASKLSRSRREGMVRLAGKHNEAVEKPIFGHLPPSIIIVD
jgi:hypothetical protein